MAAEYPSALKSFLPLVDGVDTVVAQHPNARADEIVAVETELGLLPKGPHTDVVERLDRTNPHKFTNKSGGSLAANDVVIDDTATDQSVVTTTSVGSLRKVGIVADTSIANNAIGYVAFDGIVTVKVTGTVTRGNFLRTSATAKSAEDAGNAVVEGVFARALTGGTGTVTAIMIGGANEKKSGLKFIETLDCTSGTSKTTATLPTDADLFFVVIENVSGSSANSEFRMRLNSDSTGSYDFVREDGAAFEAKGSNDSSFKIADIDGSTERIYGVLYVPRLVDTSGNEMMMSGNVSYLDLNTSDLGKFGKGRYHPASISDISTMTFLITPGNFDGGKIHIYQVVQ